MSSQAFVNHEDGSIRANAAGAYVLITPTFVSDTHAVFPDEPVEVEVRITPPDGWRVVTIAGSRDGGDIIVRLVKEGSE